MNQMSELHDSELAIIWFDYRAAIIIFSHLYIHKSEGKPGIDPGSGWSQRAELVIGDATEIDLPSAWPCKIYDGFLELNGDLHDNEIPIPLAHSGSVRFKLDFADDDDNVKSLEIMGHSAHPTLLGEAQYVEEYRAHVE